MKFKTLLSSFTLIMLILSAGCKKDDFMEVTGICPLVLTTDPPNNAINVPLNKIIAVTFNEKMNPATININTFKIVGLVPLTGTISYSGNTAFFTPSTPLLDNTTYSGLVTTHVKDVQGNALQVNYTWTFATGPTLSPLILTTDPENAEFNVALNKVITVSFNSPMDPLTITTGNISLRRGNELVSGNLSYLGLVATFIPTVPLSVNTLYTGTVTTGVRNQAGVSLASDYTWSFTTNSSPGTPFVDLRSAIRFGVLAAANVTNVTGVSEIRDMDLGLSPGTRSSITGFPQGKVVNGAIYASDDLNPTGVAAMLILAKSDLVLAHSFAKNLSLPASIVLSGDQGGKTLAPGIYKSTSTFILSTGHLTLDAGGDPNAVWIFQVETNLTTTGGIGGNIILTDGAQAKNIFWQVGSTATIGDYTSFKGTLMAGSSITMNAGAEIVGRLLSISGSVNLVNSNIIQKP